MVTLKTNMWLEGDSRGRILKRAKVFDVAQNLTNNLKIMCQMSDYTNVNIKTNWIVLKFYQYTFKK